MNRLQTLWTELKQRTDYESCVRPRAARFRLDTMEALVHRLEDVHLSLPVLHVAGSKGKGTVCHYLAKGLQAAGLRTGLYTSPHLSDWRERILLDGDWPTDDALADALETVLRVSSGEESFFDLMTATALVFFRDSGCEVAIVETGLGGRWDSTNVVQPLAAAVTSIELEHVDVLGNTLAQIAAEKAGIFKAGSLLFAGGPMPAEAFTVLQQQADQCGQVLHPVSQLEPEFFHPQEHMRWNFALAVHMLQHLPRPFAAAADILRSLPFVALQLPGRFEMRRSADGRLVVLDVAHSLQSLRSVVHTFREQFQHQRRGVVLALRDDKDAVQLAAELEQALGPRPEGEEWWAAPAGHHPRSADPVKIGAAFAATPLTKPELPAGPDVLLVTGSTYLVGALRPQTQAWKRNS